MTTEDTRLLDDLRDMWWRSDPPPAHLTAAMIAAVELRLDPTVQCKWKPLLDPNAPALCGEGSTSKVVFADTFDRLYG